MGLERAGLGPSGVFIFLQLLERSKEDHPERTGHRTRDERVDYQYL